MRRARCWWVLIVLACQPTAETPPALLPEALRVGTPVAPVFGDPLATGDAQTGHFATLIHEGLVVAGDSLVIRPGVAERWERQKKTLRFHLHPDVRFADGTPLELADVRYSLERLVDPANPNPLAGALAALEGVDRFRKGQVDSVAGIVCVDSLTVELRFTRFYGPILEALADPRAAIVQADSSRSPSQGLGPWHLESATRLVPRPHYHNRPPELSALEWVVVADAPQGFSAGSVDCIEVAGDAPPGALAARTSWALDAVALDCKKYPFDSRRVRQALHFGADLSELSKGIWQGAAPVALGPLPPGMPGDGGVADPYRFDSDWARELLEAAGLPRGFHMDVVYSGAADASTVDALRLALRPIGIELRLVAAGAGEYQRLAAGGHADAVLIHLEPPVLSPAIWMRRLFHSTEFGAGGNVARFESRAVDRALSRIDRTYDPSARARHLAELEAALHRAAPWLFLWHPPRRVAVAARVVGYTPMPDRRLERYLDVRLVGASDARP